MARIDLASILALLFALALAAPLEPRDAETEAANNAAVEAEETRQISRPTTYAAVGASDAARDIADEAQPRL